MNKMIAVINEPEDCMECPFLHYRFTDFKCGLSDEWMKRISFDKRPDWCELKTNGVYIDKEEYNELLEYKYMYKDLAR